MKQAFQIIKDIVTPTGGENAITYTERLKEGYSKCIGVFITPISQDTDLSQVEISLKIAQQEIFPSGFDASLIAHTGFISMKDAMFDISNENIPAKSSELELVVSNNGTAAKTFSLYLVLSKD